MEKLRKKKDNYEKLLRYEEKNILWAIYTQ